LLAADCQIRRQIAGSDDPAGANCDVLNLGKKRGMPRRVHEDNELTDEVHELV
jgi:hypothetical protein